MLLIVRSGDTSMVSASAMSSDSVPQMTSDPLVPRKMRSFFIGSGNTQLMSLTPRSAPL